MKNINKAVFIDRDGVIVDLPSYKVGKNEFIFDETQLNIIDESPKAIKLLKENHFRIFIVTNNPQVGSGLITEEKARLINNALNDLLKKQGAEVDEIYFCPHHPIHGIGKYKIKCKCRKPEPGMILEAAEKHRIDLTQSYMIGDRVGDIKAGKSAGCRTIGVKTGYACDDGFSDAIPDMMAKNLGEAADLILKENGTISN